MPAVRLVKIPICELYPLVYECFSGDEELTKYSLMRQPSTVKMAKRNYHDVVKLAKKFRVVCYRVMLGEESIGFTALCYAINDLLYSFGINHKHRTKETLVEWLRVVGEHFERTYYVPLSCNNKRAISFFEKNGYNGKYVDEKINQLVLWRRQS